MRTVATLAALAAAWMLWPLLSTQPHQKLEWVVSSTPAHKGHPTDQPDTVECTHGDVDDVDPALVPPTKIITYARWRELKLNDSCPEGDR